MSTSITRIRYRCKRTVIESGMGASPSLGCRNQPSAEGLRLSQPDFTRSGSQVRPPHDFARSPILSRRTGWTMGSPIPEEIAG